MTSEKLFLTVPLSDSLPDVLNRLTRPSSIRNKTEEALDSEDGRKRQVTDAGLSLGDVQGNDTFPPTSATTSG